MTAEEIAQRLKGTHKSPNGWTACCPAHDDRNASLSVSEGADGKILLKCHAGCSAQAICAALGVELRDLFAPKPAGKQRDRRMAATYDYVDAAGNLLFQVCRFEPKDFRQRRPDPATAGQWLWDINGTPRVLYRLPAVLKAKTDGRIIFVVEGEKDVEALEGLGLVGTCNPGGAGKWQQAFTDSLAGAKVIILPDKDAPGRKHAALVVQALTGKAESVRVVELPDRSEQKVKDAADWIIAGGTRDELRAIIKAAPAWPPPTETPTKITPKIVPFDGMRRLGPKATFEEIGNALREVATALAGMDKLTASLAREECFQKLKELNVQAPAKLLAAAFDTGSDRDNGAADGGQSIALQDPESWPEPVDGRELIQDITTTIGRHVVLPEEAIVAAAFWVLHAHTQDTAFISPFLALLSPEKRCGKTTMIQVVGALSPRRLYASNITPAALFRAVEKFRPTLIIDEADTFLGDNEELRGVLNSGHTRRTAFVIRTQGENHDPVMFTTWCPKIIALIGKMRDTLEDRSIIIPMRRKAPGDNIDRLRADRLDALEPLCRRAWRWGRDHLDTLRAHEPTTPTDLNDRATDNWRPLLAIADAIGGEWPKRARRAAVALSCRTPEESESVRELLLSDIRTLFAARATDRLWSEDIVSVLAEMEDRPWPEFSNGKPLTKTKLAKLLRPFDIASRDVRIGQDTPKKGYLLESFMDAFSRYLPESATARLPLSLLAETFALERDDTPLTPENEGVSRCRASEAPLSESPPCEEFAEDEVNRAFDAAAAEYEEGECSAG